MNKRIREKAKQLKRKVLLPETSDIRTLKAAEFLFKEGIAIPVLMGVVNDVHQLAKENSIDLSDIEVIDPLLFNRTEDFILEYYESLKPKGITIEQSKKDLMQDVFFAAMLLKHGYADSLIAGAINSTANVLRAGLRIIGLKEGLKTVSSFFIMITDKKDMGEEGVFLFADCAVVPYPTSVQIADIAQITAENAKKLLNISPKVALLSFSTKGSSNSPEAQRVIDATHILTERKVDFIFDGELQVDTSIVPDIAKRKAPESPLEGKANVLIFPDLNAGNIGYKLVQRLADALAIGPVLQGFSKPICDLSRGCSWEDIVDTSAISCLL